MIDLSTKYLGLQLNNPIIVASSGLTHTAETTEFMTVKRLSSSFWPVHVQYRSVRRFMSMA